MELVENTIESSGDALGAIEVALQEVAGDSVQRLTVRGNAIRLTRPGKGVSLTAGGGARADGNRITQTRIARNTIHAPGGRFGINTWSGFRGGSRNRIEGLRITENTIRFARAPTRGQVTVGIAFAISDDCYPAGCPAGAVFPKRNLARRVQVIGNVIKGPADGIIAPDPCCGGPTGSRFSQIRIARNVIKGPLVRHDRNPWGVVIGSGGGPKVSRIAVNANTIVQRAPGPRPRYAAYLAGGGVAVLGGLWTHRGSIRDVAISHNRIRTPLAGVTILGGGPSGVYANLDSTRSRVHGVELRGNRIARVPVLATRWKRGIKGISVIGGLGAPRPGSGRWPRSVRNSVSCIKPKGNAVAGRRDAVSVFANLGPRASRNSARLGGC